MASFCLNRATRVAFAEEIPPIRSAVRIFQRDQAAVLTREGEANQIRLERDTTLPPEAWTRQVSEKEILLRYGDALGAVYALLKLSEDALDIAPLFFWNDQPMPSREAVCLPCGTQSSRPWAVRYRGWFINDEVLLDPWKQDEAEHREVWRMTFETLLRCGGNMVIAGTDRHEDGLDMLASDMGLILTQHHAELLGAEMFGRMWPELPGSYRLYPERFEQLWRAAARKYQGRRVIYAIGFRGQGDSAFWHEDDAFDTPEKRGAEISRIMRRQMEIVRESSPDALFCTNLYGEMMQLYRHGALQVPEGVIKIWADNGYGRMLSRRQGDSNPRVDAMPWGEAGENGIYYHASFYDLQAANHITQLQIPPRMIAEELNRVLAAGADAYWIINCGSVKPHMYMLDFIRQVWTDGHADAQKHAEEYALLYFGDATVAALLMDYADCAVAYGEHPDDLAGDQYYHFSARILACCLMRGDTSARELFWAEQGDLTAQATALGARCRPAIARWRAYVAQCEQQRARLAPYAARLLEDTLEMNARLHLAGCVMLTCMASGFQAWQEGRADEAFYRVGEALEANLTAIAAMEAAAHDRWAHYYDNDCFTNLRLTAEVLRALRSWMRACGDGPHFWNWERKHLMKPEECRVMLQTHRHSQLTDDALFEGMKAQGAFAVGAKGKEGEGVSDAL